MIIHRCQADTYCNTAICNQVVYLSTNGDNLLINGRHVSPGDMMSVQRFLCKVLYIYHGIEYLNYSWLKYQEQPIVLFRVMVNISIGSC